MGDHTNYNDAQKRAVYHNKGPAMILAGPGSGKTTVIVGRIRHLIETLGVQPSSILVITYTKAAALSMQQRFIREMKGQVMPVTFGTFHAVFYQIIKEHSYFNQHSLLSENEKYHLIKSLYYEEEVSNDTYVSLLKCISLYKNGFLLDQLPLPIEQEEFSSLYQKFCQKCNVLGKLDFDDMLLNCFQLLEKSPYILEKWQKRFSYIMIDEFQDSNFIQYMTIRMLALPENNLFVVGDDDQSIYGFRGASPQIMQQFLRDYDSAVKITLEINYRSRTEIIQVANQIIMNNSRRIHKNMKPFTIFDRYHEMQAVHIKYFHSHEEQSEYIVKRLMDLYQLFPYEEMAVIFRTNQEAELFTDYLDASKVPYYFGAGKKTVSSHFIVQDILAYFELALGKGQRKDLLSVMNKPDRKISGIHFLKEEIDLKETEAFLRKCGNDKQADAIKLLFSQFQLLTKLSPFLAINMIRKGMGYDRWLSEKAGKDRKLYESYMDIMDGVMKDARMFTQLEDFLGYLTSTKGKENQIKEEKQEGIALLTLHGSKGLEFSYVCIPNVNEGNIPHGRIPLPEMEEEERRLFYVGVTRAKTALDLLYLTGTKDHPRLPSRFLKPLIEGSYSVSSDSSDSSTNSSNS